MGLVYADIEIINGGDLEMVRRGYMDKDEVKSMPLNLLVDTGSYYLCLNETIQEYMQYPVVGKKKAELANGAIIECDWVDNVVLHFKNRETTCRAMILPGDNEPLLGAIPMEDLDVIINPLKQTLEVNPEHPDAAVTKIK